jgi:hypothetical protein
MRHDVRVGSGHHPAAAMKTTTAPKSAPPLIDTSRMSAGQKAALEMAEAACDERDNAGLAAGLFFDRPDFRKLLPFPRQPYQDRDQGDAFLTRLRAVLDTHADPDAIDRTGETPDRLLEELARIGAFGIKIPVRLGGLGLLQTNYSRATMLLGGECSNLAALLSAHQSISAPQPLLLFGTEEQKANCLPRCAAGEISAFALTEREVGSDPARLSTTAVPDGDDFLLNGEKLWCTNSLKAGLIAVMARTPAPERPHATTAFIVETAWPDVEIVQRCCFMGLRAIYNGVVRFTNLRVPRANLLGGEGPALEHCQMRLGRLVEISAELFVWSATLARAESRFTDASLSSTELERMLRKVRYFGKLTHQRLRHHYSELGSGLEKEAIGLGRELLTPA